MLKIALSLLIAKSAFAAFEYREVSQTSPFQFSTAVIDSAFSGDLSNPAYLSLARAPYLFFSGSNPYSLDKLFSGTVKMGTAFSGFGMQAAWNNFGMEEYSENTLEAGFNYMFIKRISLGVGLSYYNLQINTDVLSEAHNLFDMKAAILLIPFDWLNISAFADNLISFFDTEKKSILYPEWGVGAGIRPVKGLFASWNINSTAFGYINSFYISANILPYLSIRAGYAKETSSYSGSVVLVYKYISLSYGIKYHPYLGYTHSAGITLSTSSMNMDSFSYGSKFEDEPLKKDFKRVNINTCSLDELKSIPNMPEVIAERIMKYRETIGPLTKNSLVQIGLSQKESNDMLDYIYGLEEEKKHEDEIKKAGTKTKKEAIKKAIFEKLLKAGLKPASALKLSDIALKESPDKVRAYINEIQGISEEQKSKARMICSGLL